MRILVTAFPIDDMGGIINHNENLIAALRGLGHQVDFRLLVWKDEVPRSMAGGKGSISVTGMEYDQRRGYTWTADRMIPYKGKENLKKWHELADSYDFIIWQIPVPTKRKENRGNTDWLYLYRGHRNVAVVHDGNFLDSYPWLSIVSDYMTGLACVHECAYNSAEHISVPSALILNPFHLRQPNLSKESYDNRSYGFLSVQTWKAWKRVPELLAAMPYMGNITKIVAGKGIDYYYLTSKDKCKYPGVWSAAEEAGMEYLDVITNEERDRLMRRVMLGVDASWSRKYASIGSHFNRVQVEAILGGAVPVVRDLAIANSNIFEHGRNCLVVPYDATPKEFGELIREYSHLSYEQHSTLVGAGWTSIARFDRTFVAQQFVDLAVRPAPRRGTTTPAVRHNGLLALGEFFNG